MEYNTLPGTELKVSPICQGTWQFNNGVQSNDLTFPPQTAEVSKQITDKAIECGINFFDTAEAYPNSEVVLGQILEGRRRNVVIATKFNTRVPKYTAEDVEISLTKSLQNLKTDYIDLYQIHWPHIVADPAEVLAELKRQQAKGRIRHYGVSNYGPENLKEMLELGGKPVTNQLSYNLLWRGIEHSIMPLCVENDVGILAYSPLAQGLLTGKYSTVEDVPEGRRRTMLFSSSSTPLSRHEGEGAEKQVFQALEKMRASCKTAGIPMATASLSWLLQQPMVKSVIVGASSPEQVEQNVKIAHLQQEILDELSQATDELKEIFGSTTDIWAKESRMK